MAAEETPRGEERRVALVDAGLAQLAESGWSGVTHRAVAGRAGANPGLVHYYFQGTAGLRRAVAEAACTRLIGAMFDDLTGAADVGEVLAGIVAALEAARDHPEEGRLVTEIFSAAFDDPEVGALVRREFARARSRLADWFAQRHPLWSPPRTQAAAALLIAAMDGLTIHVLLDPSLPTDDVSEILQSIAAGTNTLNPPENR